jgi:hypothetical protein
LSVASIFSQSARDQVTSYKLLFRWTGGCDST